MSEIRAPSAGGQHYYIIFDFNWITHILLLCLLDKKGLPIVSKLHVQIHRLAIDFNINLQS